MTTTKMAGVVPALFLALALGACASPGGQTDADADPAEAVNRATFEANRALDTLLFRPVAELYEALVPPPARTAMHNVLNNLRSPIILLHDLLQGEGERAGTTAARLAINSTIGVLGLGDPAADWGLPFHDEDFGQTLGAWGLGDGGYVVLPALGPSSSRDALGMLADLFLDPLNILAANTGHEEAIYARAGMEAVDWRARNLETLDQLERTSVDYYATLRSAYRQRRASEIANGVAPDLPPGPMLEPDAPSRPASSPSAAAPPVPSLAADLPAAAAPPPSVKPRAAPAKIAKPLALAPKETRVHLGSYTSHDEALTGWETLLERHGGTLSGAEPAFTEVRMGSQTYVRLMAAFPEPVQGTAACAHLQAGNAFCTMLN
ncbi:MAG: VacJ family lipoprotein [Magnetospirillum sp. WYHS-4]